MQALHYLGNTQLQWQDIPDATVVNATDAIVRPLAVAACDLDRAIVAGVAPFKPPFVLGHDFTGEVIAPGEHVTTVHVGATVLWPFHPRSVARGEAPAGMRGLYARAFWGWDCWWGDPIKATGGQKGFATPAIRLAGTPRPEGPPGIIGSPAPFGRAPSPSFYFAKSPPMP